MRRRVLAFADDYGLPQLLRHLPPGQLVAVVAAGIRPHQHPALRDLAAQAQVPLLVQPLRDESGYARFLEQARELAPDCIVVNSYSMRIGPELLGIAGGRGINVHGALLPQYRGANPIQWALINDERETGVTLHRLTEAIDEGDILSQRRVEIGFGDTWRDVQARIAEATESLLAEKLVDALEDRCTSRPQDATLARYHRRRRPEDGLIDWSCNVRQVYNLIRALVRPHPGAFYVTAAGKVLLDEYLTISEVFALKHRVAPFAELELDGLRLSPLGGDESDLRSCGQEVAESLAALLGRAPLHRAGNAAIVVLASPTATAEARGLVALHRIDWTAGSARIETRIPGGDASLPGARSLAPRLAELFRRELGLARISN